MHGDIAQNQREVTLKRFKNKEVEPVCDLRTGHAAFKLVPHDNGIKYGN